MAIQKVVSGGQTGVDRAALDVARELGIPAGGWCPRGRLAEDGIIPQTYALTETPSTAYAERTEWNIRDSDGTLVLHGGTISGGTALTVDLSAANDKPCICVLLPGGEEALRVSGWLRETGITTLNVAGPRESQHQGIYMQAYSFLKSFLSLKT